MVFGTDGLASQVPWLGNYLYAIIQAVIVIFLSGNFLQSDRKLDTTGVIWVRPVTNSAYIAGKVWGTMKVFFVLNIVTLLLVAYLHIAVVRSPFMLYPYVLYLFVISLPSLIFMLGLPCFVMSFVRSRALGYILLLGLTACCSIMPKTWDTAYWTCLHRLFRQRFRILRAMRICRCSCSSG